MKNQRRTESKLSKMYAEIQKKREERVWRKIAGTWDMWDEVQLHSDIINYMIHLFKNYREGEKKNIGN